MSKSPETVSRASKRSIQRSLLGWYDAHQRDLPWRRTRDPYAIWISEIMLQQTQVATVVPYYEKFLKRFPDVRTLARARQQTVLKVWEGLGYYSRARNLHAAAKVIISEHRGRLPRTIEGLRTLPGIGPYTAGAIASIAYELDEPVLDGNIIRVLTRLFSIDGIVSDTATVQKLWQLAGDLVPRGRASTFNQALMDLGATICTPRKPQCLICPLQKTCSAAQAGTPDAFPRKKQGKPVPHHDIGVGIVWRNGRILIDRRKPGGLLGGLWEFPGGKRRQGESLPACVRREIREELNVDVKVDKKLTTVSHAYSHFKVTLHVYHCHYVGGRVRAAGCAGWKWVYPNELERFPFPAANRKFIPLLTPVEPAD